MGILPPEPRLLEIAPSTPATILTVLDNDIYVQCGILKHLLYNSDALKMETNSVAV